MNWVFHMINHKAFFCFTAFNLKFNVSHILQKQDDLLTLKDNTKILSETDTETFFHKQSCLKPKSRLFSWDQILQNRNWYFFPRPNFPKPNLTFSPRPNSPKPKAKPYKNWLKSRDRDRNRDFSISLTIFVEIFSSFFFFFSSRKKDSLFLRIFSSFFLPVFLLLWSRGELQRRRNRDPFSEHENQKKNSMNAGRPRKTQTSINGS